MDSEIDAMKIVGIETHAFVNIAGVLPYDFAPTIKIGEKTYNTITALELSFLTLTVVSKDRQQVLSNMPFTSIFNVPALYTLPPYNKKRYKKFLLDVLSGESYITFNFNSIVSPPFAIPIEFFFDENA